MNDYEKCETYQIKKKADGICIGNDGAKCEFCPAYLRYKVKIEQEPVEPTWQQGKAYCGSCGKRIPLKIGARYCHKCGSSVKWNATD